MNNFSCRRRFFFSYFFASTLIGRWAPMPDYIRYVIYVIYVLYFWLDMYIGHGG